MIELNIKKDYIEKTKEYLKNLRVKLTKKDMLKDEIEILKERQSLNDGIEYGCSIQNSSYKSIADLIESYDTQITHREAQIDKIDFSMRMYEIYSRELTDTEKNIINLRYLKNKRKNRSFEYIAEKLKYSKSQVARIHDEAIEKLAFYIYGEEATYV